MNLLDLETYIIHLLNLFITVDNTMNIAWNIQFHLAWWHFIQIPPKPPTPPYFCRACGVHWFQKRLRHPQGFQISQALDLPPLTQASSDHQNDMREFKN